MKPPMPEDEYRVYLKGVNFNYVMDMRLTPDEFDAARKRYDNAYALAKQSHELMNIWMEMSGRSDDHK